VSQSVNSSYIVIWSAMKYVILKSVDFSRSWSTK